MASPACRISVSGVRRRLPGRQQHDEFVAPEPGEGVAGAQPRRQPRRHGLEHPVARIVAMLVAAMLIVSSPVEPSPMRKLVSRMSAANAGAGIQACTAPGRRPAAAGGMRTMRHMNLHLIQARANRLANQRLLGAVAQLGDAEFHAPRISFFPSVALTLNHLLNVDHYYIAALEGNADMRRIWASYVPAATVAELATRQAVSDERLIALCAALTPADDERIVPFDRGAGIEAGPREPLGRVLAHLFMHQTHHRGQAHAMLAGTSVKPPQLDDFILLGDAVHRGADMAALGWVEPV